MGHGGASGYLALLSFYGFPHEQMAASALCLNLLVAGMAFWAYQRAKHFSWEFTRPFILISIPAAFLGGMIKIPQSMYALLLACVLLWAATRLFLDSYWGKKEAGDIQNPPFLGALFMGGMIGLLSGIVGVGGGIFLSPMLLFFHWATAKRTSATSAFFIFVNSFAGLMGRMANQSLAVSFSAPLTAMIIAAFLGGLLGSRMGANHFTHDWLKRILAVVLLIASFKLFRSL